MIRYRVAMQRIIVYIGIIVLLASTIYFQAVMVQRQAEMIKTLETSIQTQDKRILNLVGEVTRLENVVDVMQSAQAISRGATVQRISVADMKVIAGVVHAEAKGEPSLGKMLVAKVIMNRMKWNGMSATEIVTKPNQFAPWEQPDKASMDAVKAAMLDSTYDNLSGFHNPVTATNTEAKEHKILLTVGNHDFW